MSGHGMGWILICLAQSVVAGAPYGSASEYLPATYSAPTFADARLSPLPCSNCCRKRTMPATPRRPRKAANPSRRILSRVRLVFSCWFRLLDDADFVGAQAVQIVHKLVDPPIRSLNLAGKTALS